MPYGGTTPAQDKKIEKCVKQVMADPKFKPQKGSKKSAAIAVCKSRIMGKSKENKILENVPLKFTTDIKESYLDAKNPNERKVMGTLLVPTTSRNDITYEIEEINNAKFNGRLYVDEMELTASLNHTEDVTDNVAIWKPILIEGRLDYEAKVFNTGKHPYVTEMLDKGLIKHVSLEAIARTLEEKEDKVIARGLDITGMGFVKTPGVKEVSLAIAEAFKNHTDSTIVDDKESKRGKEEIGDIMAKDEQPKETEKAETPEETETTETTEKTEVKLAEVLQKFLDKQDNTAKLVEKIEALEKKLEDKETKGQVTTETKPKEEPIKLVRTKEGKFPKNKTKGVDLYTEDIVY